MTSDFSTLLGNECRRPAQAHPSSPTPNLYEIILQDGECMAEHKVFCVKLKKELPGLDEPPFDNELGQKIYDNVSQEAWNQWVDVCKMILNEYRLNPARREDQEVIVKQMEQFFFGEGSPVPKEYVPPAS
jgi:Fe-S cluster biosynthesis and repair protein YggX